MDFWARFWPEAPQVRQSPGTAMYHSTRFVSASAMDAFFQKSGSSPIGVL